jgi:PleD family two-component response regulator
MTVRPLVDDTAIEALVRLADKALCRAKAKGRNRVNVVNLRAVESATKTT